ncbi:serine hydrolase domain-containing protein [Subtercola endophyticus]|uniref:serine hydrolase domain-containing protein n=1 Tax=Subtercola endophyticus TaxID=2895559 RepID=UPI001E341344|nr:beta-lactamase family protein [Subtercola endophyticus]UFS60667.1 beta-lactamase family protein [Subtercola endophyticus]
MKWVTDRFRHAASPDWLPPTADELQRHFDEHYLTLVPPQTLIDTLRSVAPRFQHDLVVAEAHDDRLRAEIFDLRIEAAAQPDPPHLLTALRIYPAAPAVSDRRTSAPPTHVFGDVPADEVEIAAESFTELGLVGLSLAGGTRASNGSWAAALGWANLDRPEIVRTDHRFAAHGISKLITATAVLRLVAQGLVDLDRPANDYLHQVTLSDDGATVRALLTHTAGVSSPSIHFAERVPDQATILGPIVACTGERTFAPSNAGYAVLGQLIADTTGIEYSKSASHLVLEPLSMLSSDFPTLWPRARAASGYQLNDDGTFDPAEPELSTMPAAGGLWTTASDLVRFGLGWSTILPDELAAEAIRPQIEPTSIGAVIGLGWLINPSKHIYGHPGAGPGGAASLIVQTDTGTATAVMTNRMISVEPINARLTRPIAPTSKEGRRGTRR